MVEGMVTYGKRGRLIPESLLPSALLLLVLVLASCTSNRMTEDHTPSSRDWKPLIDCVRTAYNQGEFLDCSGVPQDGECSNPPSNIRTDNCLCQWRRTDEYLRDRLRNICEDHALPRDCVDVLQMFKGTSLLTDFGAYSKSTVNFIKSPFTQECYSVSPLAVRESPWDIEFLPTGEYFITHKTGIISSTIGGQSQYQQVVNRSAGFIGSLFGLALDPEFETNGFLYVHYIYDTDNGFPPRRDELSQRYLSRVSRYNVRRNPFSIFNETVLLDNLPASGAHSGGGLEFGPDGFLYATTGDAEDRIAVRNRSSLAGKILRIGKDGSIPPDNPFEGSYVYSWGHRNPQGLAWDDGGRACRVVCVADTDRSEYHA